MTAAFTQQLGYNLYKIAKIQRRCFARSIDKSAETDERT